MRGDSLRDLYAKTLAVLGLGLLAGAGAAVDYWPVGSALPSVRAVRLPAPDVPMLAQNLERRIPAPVPERRVIVRGTIHAKNMGTARFLPPGLPAARITEAVVESPAPVMPDLTAPVGEPTELVVLQGTIALYEIDLPQSAPAAPATGFVSGALKKTKDSIVRTGAVTGATIADAFKGVFGAFKKVTPF
ncbi:MAG TPA: hypothetical protein VN700_20515 [Vicinamibacterales bacterium]|nr:hypothetical protein [Vicinamibacterales bacterium]